MIKIKLITQTIFDIIDLNTCKYIKLCYYLKGEFMQRYFIEENQIKDKSITITNSDMHHMKNVMRFKKGEMVICITNTKAYKASIKEYFKNEVELTVVEELESTNNTLNVTLAQSLIKKDKFELVLQKATELGVKEIIPLQAKRSIIKIDNFAKKLIRYNSITKEASEQSERSSLPKITNIQVLEEIDYSSYDYVFTAYARHDQVSLKQVISPLKKTDHILILIGPEGGFTETEINYLKEKTTIVSLGNTILRSETAAIYLLSAIRLMMEN